MARRTRRSRNQQKSSTQTANWDPIKERFAIAGSIALDALFFCLWAFINLIFGKSIELINAYFDAPPNSVDQKVFDIFLM